MQSTEVAEVTVVETFRKRKDSSEKMAGNKQAKCPHCGRTGKAKRIAEHEPTCHKRPS